MPLTDDLIRDSLARYEREIDRYRKMAEYVSEILRRELHNDAIRAAVHWRAKGMESLRNKLFTQRKEYDAENDVFSKMKDLAGVRVTTYIEDDRNRVVSKIKSLFRGGVDNREIEENKKDKNLSSDVASFYRATHCVVFLKPEHLINPYENLIHTHCEVQVCSILAHAWNEIEHDLGYKPMAGTLSKEEGELIKALGHLTICGDRIISQIITAYESRTTKELQKDEQFKDIYDFVVRAREWFPKTDRFGDNSGQLFSELIEEGLLKPSVLAEELSLANDPQSAGKSILESITEYNKKTGRYPDVELDPETADVMLALLLKKRAADILQRHPLGRGQGRPSRLVMIAKLYDEMKKATEP